MNKPYALRYVFLLFGFLYTDYIFAQNFEKERAGAGTAITSALDLSDILVIGWHHYAENTVIPRILKNSLPLVKSKYPNIVLLTESPEGAAIKYSPDPSHGPSYIEVLTEADRLKIPIRGADHPKVIELEKRFAEYIRTTKDEPRKSPWEVIGLTANDRDSNMAKVISQNLKEPRKVIFFVGDSHVDPVVSMLREKGLKVTGLHTTLNWATREIGFEGKVVGLLEDSEFVRGMCSWALKRLGSSGPRKNSTSQSGE